MSHEPGAFSKAFKCKCCKNPWNGESLENIENIVICNPCFSADNKGFTGIDPSNFDLSMHIGDNFYLWSNGGWKEKNPIPPEYASWNTFMALRDLNLDRLKSILDDLQLSNTLASGDLQKLVGYFQGFMDEERIEKSNIKPLLPLLSMLRHAKVSKFAV
jgi:predicted metalloendopeptidase